MKWAFEHGVGFLGVDEWACGRRGRDANAEGGPDGSVKEAEKGTVEIEIGCERRVRDSSLFSGTQWWCAAPRCRISVRVHT